VQVFEQFLADLLERGKLQFLTPFELLHLCLVVAYRKQSTVGLERYMLTGLSEVGEAPMLDGLELQVLRAFRDLQHRVLRDFRRQLSYQKVFLAEAHRPEAIPPVGNGFLQTFQGELPA